jgi:hypothetical protein
MFARLAADCGWEVTGIDARAERFPDDPRVTWLKQDVRDVDFAGFDLVCCLGLWYHLTLADQEGLAAHAAGVPLMIDTHVALDRYRSHTKHRPALSKLVTQGGYRGRLYSERGLQDRYTASFGNLASFWPTESSLRDLLFTAGYDFFDAFEPWVDVDRRFFLATSVGPERAKELDRLVGTYNRLRD